MAKKISKSAKKIKTEESAFKLKMPSLELAATGDQVVDPKELKGKITVIYFYPKDDTPGCTQESLDFSKLYKEFKKVGAEVWGVSRDKLASHEKFKSKFKFPFDLISDTEEKLCKAFDVIQEKKLYGRTYLGVERSTFVLDKAGALLKSWRKVKVAGHADEVLEFVKSIE